MPDCCSCSCACHAELLRCREQLEQCKKELEHRTAELSACRHQGASAQSAPPPSPLLTDYLPVRNGTSAPWLEAHLHELADISNGVTVPGMQMALNAWQFAPMQPGETLQEHVQRQVQGGNCPGPDSEASLTFKSTLSLAMMRLSSLQEAARVLARHWRTVARFRGEWQAILKNLLAGNYDPIVTRTVLFGDSDKGTESRGIKFIMWPAVIVDEAGQRYWGIVRQAFPASQTFLNTWRLRDFLTVAHTPSCITVVAVEGGAIMWQNAASMATYGVHGRFNTSAKHGEGLDAAAADHDLLVFGSQYNFVDLIFESNKGELGEMKAAVKSGDNFRTQVQVVHPTLRSLMGLREGEEAHHDVQMSLTRDPATLEQVYTVAQIDVTAAVLAKRQVQLAHAQLEEEKVRTEVLLHRQYELVECLGWVSEVGRSAAGDKRAAELIDSVRRQIVDEGSVDGRGEKIELLQLLGEGTFGKVYKGLWRGQEVAVKSMVLPTKMNGSEKKERMAIMEAAISSSLSHPNIVQTYTYSLKPVRELTTKSEASSGSLEEGVTGATRQSEPQAARTSRTSPAGGARSLVSAFEVQIVLELCDRGTLYDALKLGAFVAPDDVGRMNYLAVLEVAADIARGMQHLHACNIVHSDLKAANVLLQSNASAAKGVTAKISDFGLSVQMSSLETHVSGLYQGTVTHMAPETQLSGQQSNAADVYAFGITLWELYTGERPYPQVPRAYLGYQVAREQLRPPFPAATPPGYQALAECCWDASPAARPSFAEALEVLEALREAEGGVTPCLRDAIPAAAPPAAPLPRPRPIAHFFHPAPAAPSSSSSACTLQHTSGSTAASVYPGWAPTGSSSAALAALVMGPMESEWLGELAAPPGADGKPPPPSLDRPPGPHLPPHIPQQGNGPGIHPAAAPDPPAAAPVPPTPDDDALLGNSCLVMTSLSYYSI